MPNGRQPLKTGWGGAIASSAMPHRREGRLPRFVARLLVGVALLVAPWLFGATEDWAWRLLQVVIMLGFVAAACSLKWRRHGSTPAAKPGGAEGGQLSEMAHRDSAWSWWWGAPFLLLTAYVAVQAGNPSHFYFGDELVPLPHRKGWPSTVDASTTFEAFLKLLTYGALFWTVRVAFSSRRQAWGLLTALVLNGFFLAMVGLTQQFSGSDRLLGLRAAGPFSFASFVNRNNYASYANLQIPVAFAVAHHCRHLALARRLRSHAGNLMVFAALIMLVSVMATGSRAGIVLCVGLLIGWGAFELWHAAGTVRETRMIIRGVTLVAVVCAIWVFLAWTESLEMRWSDIWNAPAELGPEGGRGAAYQATLRMFQDHRLFGIGAGTFSLAYPYYSTERPDWFRRYAHNDWLQYLAELGTVGMFLLVAVGAGICYQQLRAGRRWKDPDWLALSLWLAIAGVAVHALVDFPLHIPSISILVVAYAALLTVPSVHKYNEQRAAV
ncbi:MAG: O-antigen ligase family protein [Verrucomicrobiae bacterium]|nr:O-antigen ligase family protein [Verrucomicrobiae bacterium]